MISKGTGNNTAINTNVLCTCYRSQMDSWRLSDLLGASFMSLCPSLKRYKTSHIETHAHRPLKLISAAHGKPAKCIHSWSAVLLQRNVSEIRSTTLAQFLLNWTLAELADMYQPPAVPETPTFDVTNVEDWYQQVVMPVLMRFLPDKAALMHQNIKLAFEEVL